jgi:citrate lyase subunit beta/citryl-CoA lyase
MSLGRTLLFVPGDRPDRIAKALATDADAVAVDLEDAVADAVKEQARSLATDALAGLTGTGPAVFVRINGLETPWAEADLAAVIDIGDRLAGVIVPKVESAAQVHRLDETLPAGLVVVPIVETARGVLEAPAIAAAPRVPTLVFGSLDLSADLGVSPSVEGRELLHARSHVVLATAAAGLVGPIDGPHADLDDEEGLTRSSIAARELGFTGRVVLHPRQLAAVRAAFSPSEAELDRAREVMAAYRRAQAAGVGAVRLPDGTFIDRPVVVRAAALLGEEVVAR